MTPVHQAVIDTKQAIILRGTCAAGATAGAQHHEKLSFGTSTCGVSFYSDFDLCCVDIAQHLIGETKSEAPNAYDKLDIERVLQLVDCLRDDTGIFLSAVSARK